MPTDASSKTDLAGRRCVPCEGGVPALEGKDLDDLHAHFPEWELVDRHHLSRTFEFPDFAQALAFVNRVGEMSEDQGHHPVIEFTWGEVTLKVWTHKVDGLTESDFIWAAKAEALPRDAADAERFWGGESDEGDS